MIKKPVRGLFVTGTDTEVGKTYVGSIIVKNLRDAGYRVGVYKPSASDCVSDGQDLISEDAVALWEAAGKPGKLHDVCPQRFRAALAPHLSAKAEGKSLDPEQLRKGIEIWADNCDIVIVEGAGGLMTPVSDTEFIADLAMDLGYPLIVVAPNVLGVINQTLQTMVTASCFREGLEVGGIVLNDAQMFDGDVSIESNQEEISSRSVAPVLGRLRFQAEDFDEPIDWFALTNKPQSD
jgi:dethiobiotin synthetase